MVMIKWLEGASSNPDERLQSIGHARWVSACKLEVFGAAADNFSLSQAEGRTLCVTFEKECTLSAMQLTLPAIFETRVNEMINFHGYQGIPI